MKRIFSLLMMIILITPDASAQLAVVDAAAQPRWIAQLGSMLDQLRNMEDQLDKAKKSLDKVEKVNQTIKSVKYVYASVERCRKAVDNCHTVLGATGVSASIGSSATSVSYALNCIRDLLIDGKYNLTDKERIDMLQQVCAELNRTTAKLNSVARQASYEETFYKNIFKN